jgi:hypothetical protein
LLPGLVDPGDQVVTDAEQAWPLRGVEAKERASDVPLTELTGARVGYRSSSTDCD